MTLAGLVQRWRRWKLARRGLALHRSCCVGPGVCAEQGAPTGRLSAGRSCRLEAGVQLHAWGGWIEIADNVFIGPYAIVYGHGGVRIGRDTLVSMHCRILSSNHSVPPHDVPIRSQPDVLAATEIGADVWLGAGVTVLAGVRVGDGCIVGAGAVVTESLPAGSIAVGVPARVVGSRSGAACGGTP